jgi:hypothetical protein
MEGGVAARRGGGIPLAEASPAWGPAPGVFGWERARLYLDGRRCAPAMKNRGKAHRMRRHRGFFGGEGVAPCASRARTGLRGGPGGAGSYGGNTRFGRRDAGAGRGAQCGRRVRGGAQARHCGGTAPYGHSPGSCRLRCRAQTGRRRPPSALRPRGEARGRERRRGGMDGCGLRRDGVGGACPLRQRPNGATVPTPPAARGTRLARFARKTPGRAGRGAVQCRDPCDAAAARPASC